MGLRICCLVSLSLVLVGCGGVRGASDFAKRESYAANFDQIPLVPEKVEQGRVLQMFVFSGPTNAPFRDGYKVPFAVSIE
ncbi:MAG: hypothetical protein AAGA26_07100 [Pseudomonadota bacterium]